MAVPAIVSQSPPPAHPSFQPLADLLTHTYAANPDYGIPFARALDRAVRYVDEGIQYEPYNATHYRVQSHSRTWLWHYATLHQCSCNTRALWCWHRALLHLLTAHTALLTLERCPRPTLAYVLPRKPHDMTAILQECDEMF